ncbi:hypothetical protein BGZ61DRAFT_341108 [Ilyonectria robusta]|uniref:uncharacterized protein n=1 Tax=Ilyonectria robusta TaxID=1079257 RepID=UPI001E8E4916|nr:uncharacterized protein BGZ61DRAFT_341108 [Ilyonectria robusta]KAH8736539.1 hypothetical protein BGZ61DRAFT_341108 [Ilyonectria robusta]
MGKESDAESRSAAEYALAQQCFRDHRGAPYRFQDQIRDMRETIQQVESDGLIHQPGLVATHLPFTEIDLDLIDGPEPMLASPCSPPDPTISASFIDPAAFRTFRELRISPEPLDLGFDIKKDTQQFLDDIYSKRFCNVLNEWLPLSPVNTDKDQGLEFSSASSRWQMLALREINRKNIEVSDAAKQLVRIAEDTTVAQTTWLSGEALGLNRAIYLEPVSPPLSPSSSLDDPFVPSRCVTIIDLTSEPSSPLNSPVAKLQKDLQNGCVDSEPVAPFSSSRSSSPPNELQCFGSPRCKKSTLKLDVPLVISSPFQLEPSNSFTDAVGESSLDTEEIELQPTGAAHGFFDEAMEAIIDSGHERTVRRLEDERLNPTDSFLRVQVPTLSFDHPEPEWKDHLSSPGAQFKWIKRAMPIAFQLPPASSLAQLGTSLKWTPIPPGTGRVSSVESLEPLSSASRHYLMIEIPRLGSGDYVSKTTNLSILRIFDDEEIEPDTSLVEDTSCAPISVASSAKTSSANDQQGSLDAWWKAHLPIAQSSRKKAIIRSNNLLPHTNDSSATSKLLSSFIQLRRPKRFKLSEDFPQHARPVSEDVSKHLAPTSLRQNLQDDTDPNIPKAPVPTFCIPFEKCRFVVSMSLNRTVLCYIEKTWPQVELIDKDFSQYNETKWSPGSTQRQEVKSILSSEADIALSPSAGIILTTMLKVKQKPLPGSNSPTPLRSQVQRVSEKYESLYIIVSEGNPQGEYVGTPSASDMTAYADFVRFTTSLQAGVTTELIHGAEETLGKWTLALMSRFAAESLQFAHLVNAEDTEWGLFLRRAGMNIIASQVLEGLLVTEYGDLGMVRFLAASCEERVLKYGQMMGGNRVLANVSRQLDKG